MYDNKESLFSCFWLSDPSASQVYMKCGSARGRRQCPTGVSRQMNLLPQKHLLKLHGIVVVTIANSRDVPTDVYVSKHIVNCKIERDVFSSDYSFFSFTALISLVSCVLRMKYTRPHRNRRNWHSAYRALRVCEDKFVSLSRCLLVTASYYHVNVYCSACKFLR